MWPTCNKASLLQLCTDPRVVQKGLHWLLHWPGHVLGNGHSTWNKLLELKSQGALPIDA